MVARGVNWVAAAVAVLVAGGCSGSVDTHESGEGTSGGGGSGSTGGSTGNGGSTGAGGVCSDVLQGPCAPQASVCKTVPSLCLALENNCGADVFTLRMSQILFTSPSALAGGVVGQIIGNSLTMNLQACNQAGGGTFSWLLQFNAATGKLVTGGAKPAADPTAGYCFVNETIGASTFAPSEGDMSLESGKFTAKVGDLNVPMFLDLEGSQYVALPIRETILTGVLSADNNCIGRYNAATLSPETACMAEPPGKLAFANHATVNGYITLEDADATLVDTLGQSLCVLISGDPATFGDGQTPSRCKRDGDGKIVFQGNWCASTNDSPSESCADAEKFFVAFAASGVKLRDDCP